MRSAPVCESPVDDPTRASAWTGQDLRKNPVERVVAHDGSRSGVGRSRGEVVAVVRFAGNGNE